MTVPPSRYVEPDVDEARLARVWGNVAERLQNRRKSPWRWAALSAALAATATGAFVWLETRSAPLASGNEHAVLADAKLETKSDELAVTLGDGSLLELSSQSAATVHGNRSNAISLELSRGKLSCDVPHVQNRKFAVVAGDVEVRVVGTKFSVKRDPGPDPRVEVSVTRGLVEVESARRPGVVSRVAAGQSWIQDGAGHAAADSPSSVRDADTAGAEPSKLEPAAAPSVKAPPSARDLFEKAGESRRSGDSAAAARAYEELLRLHPTDARASLAAFELGRLRMDRLGDLAGAITALERAVALNIGPTFREDAMARLASVYASQGNFAACQRARDRYLTSYPAGVHAAAVASRCGSP
ncbi:MAG TPA: FecR domain-containing protein [Polyangiaceae bacterium]|nr:FecR domain-containing protein [Polyangiaceae bacterium]